MKKNRKGYVLIYKPDHKYSLIKKGWILEHRAVVEDFLKRRLKSGECVHHIDGHKKNNKIENLMLFKNNAEHQKFHAKIKQFGFTTPILRQIEERWGGVYITIKCKHGHKFREIQYSERIRKESNQRDWQCVKCGLIVFASKNKPNKFIK